jgi:hypothetical protein
MDLRIVRMIVGISTCMLVFTTLTHLTLVCQAQAGKLSEASKLSCIVAHKLSGL